MLVFADEKKGVGVKIRMRAHVPAMEERMAEEQKQPTAEAVMTKLVDAVKAMPTWKRRLVWVVVLVPLAGLALWWLFQSLGGVYAALTDEKGIGIDKNAKGTESLPKTPGLDTKIKNIDSEIRR